MMGKALLSLPILLVSIAGCSSAEPPGVSHETLCSTLWIGEAGGDSFVLRFNPPGSDRPGVIHCLNGGKMYSEVPMGSVSFEPPALEVNMPTGITYTGTVSPEGIRGEIGDMPLDLLPVEEEQVPGLAAYPLPYEYSAPEDMNDGLGRGTLSVDAAERIVDRIASGEAGLIHSLLIWTDGVLVFEEYFHGYNGDDLHRLMSVTKSVASILIGIAIDEGFISGVNHPLSAFVQELAGGITLEHLLTMSMGLNWTDSEAEELHLTGEELVHELSGREQAVEPGTCFRYVNTDVNILSLILQRATGLYPDRFAEEYLFNPLGVTRYEWSYGESGGHRLMDGSLHLRPRDMMKLGVLMVQEGEWNNSQVVSEEWVTSSVTPSLPVDNIFQYGYLWWITEWEGGRVWLASGWGSQFIAVLPDAGMVVVTTGGNDDNGKNWNVLRVVLEELAAL